ncbi:hypothetical protein BKA70DRAFT_1426783 [Coprinopsis sp. MPI-PUGE-AT-0042]|nr:hypothetical protein BKA70DRAFT_1426783 [Coprinopsis sp. MPI-PUGE-AT-0042]
MDPSNDLSELSTCTTCTFSENNSNYWTAVLYFRHKNGTVERVPQIPEELVGPANGGMTLYYIQPPGASKVTAFPKGFRMIIGDPMLRSFNASSPEALNMHFRCLNAGFGNPDEGTETVDLSQIPEQIRTAFLTGLALAASGARFSSLRVCWDGIHLDTYNHKSHMQYPTNGRCPASHPVVVPQIFIELVWDTKKFNHLWEMGAPNPFVFSHGDPTGYGQHADYVFGWEGDSLQRAMDSCKSYGGPCPVLKMQSIDSINSCTQKVRVKEPVDGALDALPGCNPIQDGPLPAVPFPPEECDARKDYEPL